MTNKNKIYVRHYLILLVSFWVLIPQAQAGGWFRQWDSVNIEGGRCALGDRYNVFISPGRTDKVAFYFMGGGACWSAETCFGLFPLSINYPLPFVFEVAGFVSPSFQESPIADYTVVYFPYCTGDVHLGNHVAQYNGRKVYHYGARNVELAMAQLKKQRRVNYEKIQDVVSYGYSAGGIGALAHLKTIDQYIPATSKRTLISDSPGLHFGNKFWDKFTPELYADYRTALAGVGADLDSSRGSLSSLVPNICEKHPNWNMGFLQGSRDVVMSLVFGDIDQFSHEKLVYGPTGIYQLTSNPADNCSAWVPRSSIHTFLLTFITSIIRTYTPKTALDFSRDLIEGRGGENYK